MTGTAALPNGGDGVEIGAGVKTTTIQNNVISGNTGSGVVITGLGATGNKIQGNRIGLNAAGTAELRNGLYGVKIAGERHRQHGWGNDLGAKERDRWQLFCRNLDHRSRHV